jgi:NADH-quinone oxidoreductase subunit J
MTAGIVFFLFCSLVALVGAITVVMAKNPIRSAVGLLTTILGIAGLFLLLNAQFMAAIQLLVYAGAVVVLFIFVIMLLGPDPQAAEAGNKSQVARALGALGLLLGMAAVMFAISGTVQPAQFEPARPEHGSVEAVGGLIFSAGLVPFELVTALLVVAIVGAIALVRRKGRPPRRAAPSDNPTARLFGGPVHPRDGGAPAPKEPAS